MLLLSILVGSASCDFEEGEGERDVEGDGRSVLHFGGLTLMIACGIFSLTFCLFLLFYHYLSLR